MACSPEFGDVEPVARQGVFIKVFGVGTAGMNVLEQLMARNLSALSYSAINTDPAALAKSSAAEKIHLDTKVMRGLVRAVIRSVGRLPPAKMRINLGPPVLVRMSFSF